MHYGTKRKAEKNRQRAIESGNGVGEVYKISKRNYAFNTFSDEGFETNTSRIKWSATELENFEKSIINDLYFAWKNLSYFTVVDGVKIDAELVRSKLNNSGDYSGFIQNASENHRQLDPVGAFFKDLSADFINGLYPFEATVDDVIANDNLSGGEKFLAILLTGIVQQKSGKVRNAHLAGEIHKKTGVPFDKSGFPDFSNYLYKGGKNDVMIKPTGKRDLDRAAANKAAGYKNTPEGYIWHHHQQKGRMQLVEREVHGQTGHTGGFELWSKDK